MLAKWVDLCLQSAAQRVALGRKAAMRAHPKQDCLKGFFHSTTCGGEAEMPRLCRTRAETFIKRSRPGPKKNDEAYYTP
jgi:hypothetical protein